MTKEYIYHDSYQYVSTPEKNVVFRIKRISAKVVLTATHLPENPKPDHDMYALHTGRLTEMLLKRDDIPSFSVIA